MSQLFNMQEWLETADDKQCRAKAKEFAARCAGIEAPLELLEMVVARGWITLPEHGVKHLDYPTMKPAQRCHAIELAARLKSDKWWSRRLRTLAIRAAEARAYSYGIGLGKSQAYVSPWNLERMVVRAQQSAAAIAETVIISPDGEVIDMADVMEGSMANGKNKRTELIVRTKGMAERAQALGYRAYAITLTAPGCYHRCTSVGEKPQLKLILNKKWNGFSQQQTASYLTTCWAQCRTQFSKADIHFMGLRTLEPHKDGTPHWHLVFFVKPQQASEALKIIRDKYLHAEAHEKKAQQVRVKIDPIKPRKGQDMAYAAVAYAIAYIAKNIDGYKVDWDIEACLDAINGAQRATIWARILGRRQFQLFGTAPVTHYREARRVQKDTEAVLEQLIAHDSSPAVIEAAKGLLDGDIQPCIAEAMQAMRTGRADVLGALTNLRDLHLGGAITCPTRVLGDAWAAANIGDFGAYMLAMEKDPLELVKREQVNGYGEVVKVICGVQSIRGQVLTHQEGWTVQWGAKGKARLGKDCTAKKGGLKGATHKEYSPAEVASIKQQQKAKQETLFLGVVSLAEAKRKRRERAKPSTLGHVALTVSASLDQSLNDIGIKREPAPPDLRERARLNAQKYAAQAYIDAKNQN
ncbi:replication endonuclease [Iodobacter sp. CM08]|uniref:replication endonuclease n=1 Tax=Iodobacter sp. CM08 TaxID=3085902 RepID=UPI002980BAFC|nr:replication endonuclease [Iodobacter sp. CM08]MDW5417465.1 replication endonuclease [Iodobacter sp. CM08]